METYNLGSPFEYYRRVIFGFSSLIYLSILVSFKCYPALDKKGGAGPMGPKKSKVQQIMYNRFNV